MKILVVIFTITLFLSGCDALTGEEIGRLQISELSTEGNLIIKETTLDLKKDDDIAIWSDMDIAYEDNVGLQFRIEILKDSTYFGELEIDPTDKNITLGEVKTTIMDKTNWSFSGKNSSILIEEDGNYTFRGILIASENPSLVVTKAEIVFKK